MEEGFIKLSRKFFTNDIWQAARAYNESEAWLDLIQSARFEASEITSRIGGREITWGRGQYPASNRFLAKKWGRSETWVKSVLTSFKKKGMITTECTQGMNVITLVNFDKYNYTENPVQNPTKNPLQKPLNAFNISELQELITQLKTHLETQCETRHEANMTEMADFSHSLKPTANPNNKKEEEYNNYKSSLRGSNEPLCGTSPHAEERIDYKALVDFFNKETKGVFGTVRYPISDTRRGMISARIKQHGKQAFVDMIHKAYASDFLRGQNGNSFKATFDWLIKPTNFEKVISGNYDNRSSKDCGADSANDDADFMRNIAEGIARANYEKQRRQSDGKPLSRG